MADRVYLVHNVTGAGYWVPDDPAVLADFADRGWLPAAEPDARALVFAPDPSGLGAKPLPVDYFGTDEVTGTELPPPTEPDVTDDSVPVE